MESNSYEPTNFYTRHGDSVAVKVNEITNVITQDFQGTHILISVEDFKHIINRIELLESLTAN